MLSLVQIRLSDFESLRNEASKLVEEITADRRRLLRILPLDLINSDFEWFGWVIKLIYLNIQLKIFVSLWIVIFLIRHYCIIYYHFVHKKKSLKTNAKFCICMANKYSASGFSDYPLSRRSSYRNGFILNIAGFITATVYEKRIPFLFPKFYVLLFF